MPVKNAREYDGKIRELSAQGLKIREIAERLNLSRSVVHDRRQSMGIAGKKENYETNIETVSIHPFGHEAPASPSSSFRSRKKNPHCFGQRGRSQDRRK